MWLRTAAACLLALCAIAAMATGERRAPIDDATAALLRPGGQWLTFEGRADPRGALLEPRILDDHVIAARQVYHRDWSHSPGPVGSAAGPDFDAATCQGCHIETQTGRRTASNLRIARPAVVSDRSRYGDQLTTRYLGHGNAEARVHIETLVSYFSYADGTERQLIRPFAYAETRDGRQVPAALRTAPLLYGWGLLEAIEPEFLGHFHDPRDRNGDGISGRASVASDVQLQSVPAALGWKASHERLSQQIAAALNNDMGVVSDASAREISPDELALLTDYVRNLGVPDRRPGASDRGQDLFGLTGCSACHVTAMLTREDARPQVSDQLIWPYSDFMLHDMGPELADPGDAPDAAEWRTAPLWGAGYAELHLPERGFLHDGRARDLEEAILWHGGEAEPSRDAFSQLDAHDRALLLAYIRAL